ncbi:MAG TPA: DUF2269 domain-containing protein [Burkholderiaceae bacterium]|nr:DUF2269 domain-containing protein [Burkholderiaceae bacterium]
MLSSALLFGTGLGSAYYMFFVHVLRQPHGGCGRDCRRRPICGVGGLAFHDDDHCVPASVSGLCMAPLAGYSLTSRWLLWSIVLYFVAGACWLPVVWLQIRMRRLALGAAERREPLPREYTHMLRIWTALGVPALLALVAVFYLIVARPA